MRLFYLVVAVVFALGLWGAAAVAEEPAAAEPAPAAVCLSKTALLQMLAEPPVYRVVAELSGEAAESFLDQTGGPQSTEPLVVVISETDSPEALLVVVFEADCMVAHAKLPLGTINRLLKRTSA